MEQLEFPNLRHWMRCHDLRNEIDERLSRLDLVEKYKSPLDSDLYSENVLPILSYKIGLSGLGALFAWRNLGGQGNIIAQYGEPTTIDNFCSELLFNSCMGLLFIGAVYYLALMRKNRKINEAVTKEVKNIEKLIDEENTLYDSYFFPSFA